MFPRCHRCNALMVGGHRDEQRLYCSLPCLTASDYPGFCEKCECETTDEAPQAGFTFYGIGTGLFGGKDRCRDCASVIQRRCFRIGIPVFTLGRYRVRYVDDGRLMGRKLKY